MVQPGEERAVLEDLADERVDVLLEGQVDPDADGGPVGAPPAIRAPSFAACISPGPPPVITWFQRPMIGSSRFLCSKPSTPTLAGRQKKNRPAPGGRPSQRAAIIRMMCPLENASTSPSMPRTRAMKPSARAATSPGDSPPGSRRGYSSQPGRSFRMSLVSIPSKRP